MYIFGSKAYKIDAVTTTEADPNANIYNIANDTQSAALTTEGVAYETSTYSVSEFIDISGKSKFVFAHYLNDRVSEGIRICFYNEAKSTPCVLNIDVTFAGGIPQDVEIPSGAKYVRFMYVTSRNVKSYLGFCDLSEYVYKDYTPEGNVEVKSNSEIIKARGTFPNLNARLSSYDGLVGEPQARLQADVKIQSQIDSFTEASSANASIYDISKDVSGKTMTNGGVVYDNSTYSVTDFIDIEGHDKFTFAHYLNSGVSEGIKFCFFNQSKGFVDLATPICNSGTHISIEIPSGAKYVRFTFVTAKNVKSYLGFCNVAHYEYVDYSGEVGGLEVKSNIEIKEARGTFGSLKLRLADMKTKGSPADAILMHKKLIDTAKLSQGYTIIQTEILRVRHHNTIVQTILR